MFLLARSVLLPCLRAPGRGVPEFLAGLALAFVGCVLMIQILPYLYSTRSFHLFHLQNGHRPNSKALV